MNPDKTESHDWLCMYAGTLRIQGLRDEEIFYFLLAEFNGTPYLLCAEPFLCHYHCDHPIVYINQNHYAH